MLKSIIKFIWSLPGKIYDYILENILIRTEKTKRKVKKKFEIEDSINDIRKEWNEKNDGRWNFLFSEIDDITSKYGQFSEDNFFEDNIENMDKDDAIKIMSNYDEITKDIKSLFKKAQSSGVTNSCLPEDIFPGFNENEKKLDLAEDEFGFYFIYTAYSPISKIAGLLSKKVNLLKEKNTKMQKLLKKVLLMKIFVINLQLSNMKKLIYH